MLRVCLIDLHLRNSSIYYLRNSKFCLRFGQPRAEDKVPQSRMPCWRSRRLDQEKDVSFDFVNYPAKKVEFVVRLWELSQGLIIAKTNPKSWPMTIRIWRSRWYQTTWTHINTYVVETVKDSHSRGRRVVCAQWPDDQSINSKLSLYLCMIQLKTLSS